MDSYIETVKARIDDPELAWMFEQCFPNSLDTTIQFRRTAEGPDTFVITGDIPAMWLRDSAAQLMPYLRFANEDPGVRELFVGLIRRQARCLCLDPYANAFYADGRESPYLEDKTEMRRGVHERKWELDSPAYFLSLSAAFFDVCGSDVLAFDATWKAAVEAVLKVLRAEMSADRPYRFQRATPTASETLQLKGYGTPGRPCGLIRSAFRPSDDATVFPYLIPSNAMMAVALRRVQGILHVLGGLDDLAAECDEIANTVTTAIQREGLMDHPRHGTIYAYEVDGYGGRQAMDDANVPSLLSLPWLGFCAADDPVYRNTRAFAWSKDNPYFFEGRAGAGIGGPHVGLDYIWPMSLILRGLTATEPSEVRQCLNSLRATHAGTGFMHESFHRNDPALFTRPWFGWVNSLLGELVVRVYGNSSVDRIHGFSQ